MSSHVANVTAQYLGI